VGRRSPDSIAARYFLGCGDAVVVWEVVSLVGPLQSCQEFGHEIYKFY